MEMAKVSETLLKHCAMTRTSTIKPYNMYLVSMEPDLPLLSREPNFTLRDR